MYLYNLQVSANILHLLDICESFLQFSIFLLIKIELQLFGVYVVKEKQLILSSVGILIQCWVIIYVWPVKYHGINRL